MKIIQSFWTKPIINSFDKLDGGWIDKRFHYFSWALSCLQLKKHYPEVELYTDEYGKYLLIDKLKLPYTKVVLALDDLAEYDTCLWTIGKIYTYMLQKDPFIHVDSDIFIWTRFSDAIENASLVAQEIEHSFETYKSFIMDADQHFRYVSESFKLEQERITTHASCYNTGIMGGKNVLFIQRYAKEAMHFIDENFNYVQDKSAAQRFFGIFIEQYLMYTMATQEGHDVKLFIDNYHHYSLDKDIRRVAKNIGYVHLMGGKNGGFKSNSVCCNILENWLKLNYPEYYYPINELLDNNEI